MGEGPEEHSPSQPLPGPTPGPPTSTRARVLAKPVITNSLASQPGQVKGKCASVGWPLSFCHRHYQPGEGWPGWQRGGEGDIERTGRSLIRNERLPPSGRASPSPPTAPFLESARSECSPLCFPFSFSGYERDLGGPPYKGWVLPSPRFSRVRTS